MRISMFQASAPIFIRMLTNFSTIPDKAQAHADAKKFDSANYLSARLAPDMLPLFGEMQIACGAAKRCLARPRVKPAETRSHQGFQAHQIKPFSIRGRA